jgi:uncharacterized protein YecE (DUF72 family)
MVFSGITLSVTATPASLAGLYVGTSGWSYPSWKPGFYPDGTKPADFLRHYADRFRAVELNTTGYRLPREELFTRWAEQTPAGFRFAPKLSAFARTDYGTYAERVGLLGERLGPIRVLVASARDEGLLALVLGSFDESLDLAFDFRHASWDGIEADLPANAVRVGALDADAGFRYVRLRKLPYSDDDLRVWADRLGPLLDQGVQVHCYFQHEDEPTAPAYAQRLLELLSR